MGRTPQCCIDGQAEGGMEMPMERLQRESPAHLEGPAQESSICICRSTWDLGEMTEEVDSRCAQGKPNFC
jgi:hypothetical protein